MTSRSSDSPIGQRYPIRSAKGLTEFGSRIALVSRPFGSVAAWTDTRNIRTSSEQEIFAAQIRFDGLSDPPSSGLPKIPLIAVGLLAAAAAFFLLRPRLKRSRRGRSHPSDSASL